MAADSKQSAQKREMARLEAGIRRCRRCPLHKSRMHAVPGEGPINAKVFMLGEAPGKMEDLQGKTFAGRSGIFFDRMLAEAGLSREDVYVTSSVKCRPPRNRCPRTDELAICRESWLNDQLRLVNPFIVVLLGATALRQALGIKAKLSDVHGRIFHEDGRIFLVTFHPAAGMRFPDVRKNMTRDFKILQKMLSEIQAS